jgi:hypothetical protein
MKSKNGTQNNAVVSKLSATRNSRKHAAAGAIELSLSNNPKIVRAKNKPQS